MCGIAGKVYLEPHRGVEPDALAAMCQALVHRGPDDYGVHLDGNVGLAMRRLAVIDVDTGRQPIHNEDRSVWTVYNGEIYNFAELQRELEARGHRFYTRTDTEVIVHLYEEQGLDFVRSLNGMFTIALWDAARRRLVLARDRLGIKPLYVAQLLDLLTDAVRRQLVSDVPLGVFLSGGLDSSTVVALTRRVHSGAVKTFSIGFDDPSYDERAAARLIARRFETDHTELTITPDVADLVPKLVSHFDEPFADASAIPTYYLSQLTRRHVTVALGGDGGDELFAGYVTYQADKLARLYERLPGLLTRGLIPAVVRRLPVSEGKVSFDFKARRFIADALLEPGRRHYAWKAFFDDSLKRDVLCDDVLAGLDGRLDAFPVYRRHYDEVPHHDPLNRFLYADTRVYLPDDILVKVDRMSMAHSLEVRVPLLDHRVVEFMFRLPGVLKMPGLALTHVLKRTMRGLLPDETLRKRKGGVNVSMSARLKQQLRPLVDEYLSPARVRRDGFFRPETTSRLVVEHMTGRADYSRNLWALLLFGVWLEQARTSGASAATSAIAAGLTPSFALCAPATGVIRG